MRSNASRSRFWELPGGQVSWTSPQQTPYLCQGLNSRYFHIIGDGHQPNSRGLYTHYKDSYSRWDDHPQYSDFWLWHTWRISPPWKKAMVQKSQLEGVPQPKGLGESPWFLTMLTSHEMILQVPSGKTKILLMVQKSGKHTSWAIGSLSHHLQCFFTSPVVQDFFHKQYI